jgi:Zn-dependent alcohol dehydrogenase
MFTKTEAVIVPAKGEPFKLTEIVLEEPQGDEVLVKITACG